MSYEGSSPITSRCPGSQGRQESTDPTPPCLSRACLGWASSSASILLPRENDIHPSAWKGNSQKLNFRFHDFCELRRDGVLGSCSSRSCNVFNFLASNSSALACVESDKAAKRPL